MTIEQFPNYNLYNIPEALRKLANEIESGKYLTERIIVCMERPDGNIDYAAFGRDFYWMRAVGLVESCKIKIIRDKGHI